MKRPSATIVDLLTASLLRLAEPGRRARASWRAVWFASTFLLAAVPALAQTNGSLTSTPASVAPGGQLAYGATVINDGTQIGDFDLSFAWDPHLVLRGFAASRGTSLVGPCDVACDTTPLPCVIAGGTCKPSGVCSLPSPCIAQTSGASWTVGNVAPGQAVTLAVEHEVDAQAPLTDPETLEPQLASTLTAARYLADGSLGTPVVLEHETSVFADAGAIPLFVDLSASPREVRPGDDLAYRLDVVNRGAVHRRLTVTLDLDPDLESRARQTDTPACDSGPLCARFQSTERFALDISPARIFTLRVSGRVASGTFKTELRARVQIVDDDTMGAVEADEMTSVLVCEGQADGAQCDNGDVCPDDTCRGGGCVPAACPQACNGAPRGAACSDGNACTVEECDGSGQCVAKRTGSGAPLQVQCKTCQLCDPGLGCTAALARDKVCRAAFGICDAAELCDGVSPTCPDDAFRPAGTPCDDGNPGTLGDQCVAQPVGSPRCVGSPDPCGDGSVDPGEQCDDGNRVAGDCCSPTCQYEVAGMACDDATLCNGRETCDGAGSCGAGAPLVCDAATVCGSATCDPVAGCVFDAAPATGCTTGFAKASLLVNETRKGFESLSLKLASGPLLDASVFGDPTVPGGPGYTVCFYRRDDGKLAGDLQVDRAGQACGSKPCWRRLGGPGLQYTDRDYATDGVGVIKLRAGVAGQSQINVVGRNDARKGQGSLPAGTSPPAPGIAKGLERAFTGARVQVRRDDGGACFEADLSNVARSGPTYFRATK